MVFARDHGTCCLVLPRKLGVGIIAMIAWAHSIVCIIALMTGDIRFQGNGYSDTFYKVPSIIGCLGIVFGFVGLLGVYDDMPRLLKAFNLFQLAYIVGLVVTGIADFRMLRKCDSWMRTPMHLTVSNIPLERLAEAGVCPWARWSYLIGAGVDLAVWVYFAFSCYILQTHLELNPPYPIDFGYERYDKDGRWKFYQVKDPRVSEKTPSIYDSLFGQPTSDAYGSLDNQNQHYDQQPQEEAGAYTYGPDGMRIASTGGGGFGRAEPEGGA